MLSGAGRLRGQSERTLYREKAADFGDAFLDAIRTFRGE